MSRHRGNDSLIESDIHDEQQSERVDRRVKEISDLIEDFIEEARRASHPNEALLDEEALASPEDLRYAYERIRQEIGVIRDRIARTSLERRAAFCEALIIKRYPAYALEQVERFGFALTSIDRYPEMGKRIPGLQDEIGLLIEEGRAKIAQQQERNHAEWMPYQQFMTEVEARYHSYQIEPRYYGYRRIREEVRLAVEKLCQEQMEDVEHVRPREWREFLEDFVETCRDAHLCREVTSESPSLLLMTELLIDKEGFLRDWYEVADAFDEGIKPMNDSAVQAALSRLYRYRTVLPWSTRQLLEEFMTGSAAVLRGTAVLLDEGVPHRVRLSAAYSLLRVSPGADRSKVLAAFKALALECHPDQHPVSESEQWNQRYMEVKEARRLLLEEDSI